MSFAEMLNSIVGALDAARTLGHVDDLARDLWKAYGAGKLSDVEAESLTARIEARRREIRPKDRTAVRAPHVPRVAASFFPPKRRRSVSPDRVASMERRHHLAASNPMPANLAWHYTRGQTAVFRIVADEVREEGFCALSLGEIAARAGVGVTTARDAIRAAALDGLVIIEERRQRRAPNLPNIVRVISREWMTWIKRGGRRGSKILESTDKRFQNLSLKPRTVDRKPIRRNASRGFPVGICKTEAIDLTAFEPQDSNEAKIFFVACQQRRIAPRIICPSEQPKTPPPES